MSTEIESAEQEVARLTELNEKEIVKLRDSDADEENARVARNNAVEARDAAAEKRANSEIESLRKRREALLDKKAAIGQALDAATKAMIAARAARPAQLKSQILKSNAERDALLEKYLRMLIPVTIELHFLFQKIGTTNELVFVEKHGTQMLRSILSRIESAGTDVRMRDILFRRDALIDSALKSAWQSATEKHGSFADLHKDIRRIRTEIAALEDDLQEETGKSRVV